MPQIDQPDQTPLARRFDALDYLFRLQSGRISRPNLMAIMHRLGLVARGDRREMFVTLYREMIKE